MRLLCSIKSLNQWLPMTMVLNFDLPLESLVGLLQNTEKQVLPHPDVLTDWSGEGCRHFYSEALGVSSK